MAAVITARQNSSLAQVGQTEIKSTNANASLLPEKHLLQGSQEVEMLMLDG
jgi:hypothetical protein